MHADAYAGFDCIYASGKVQEVACWIHRRRYWHEASDSDPKRANVALGYIACLSQVESQLRATYPELNLQGERDFDSIARARQQYAVPILNEFKAWLDAEINSGRILPKSLIRSAFIYTLNQWKASNRYTEQGYLSYDNNAAERAVKYPAIGHKNFLFVGNERAGKQAGYFYSLVNSAKLNGVEPFAWFCDLMEKLPAYRQSEAFGQASRGEPVTSDELDAFLPDRWLVTHPDCKWDIDAIRREERKRKEVLKRRKRK